MRKRNREILLWRSDREFKKLEKDRAAAGMSRREYIMDLVNRLPPIRCPKPDIARFKVLFDNDGMLINEMAHGFNATGRINMEEYASLVNTLCSHMDAFEKEICDEIRRINDEEKTGY